MFLNAQANLKGPICHFKCVSLRHKSRIIEYLRLEGTLNIIYYQPPE